MPDPQYQQALARTIISLKGDDVTDFLEGLICNSLQSDLTFAALLTPQGKIIADFFVHRLAPDHLILETPTKFGKALILRLNMYKLRAKIHIEDVSDKYFIHALWGAPSNIGQPDPRKKGLGQRVLSESAFSTEPPDDYDRHRLRLAVPDSQWDFGTEQMFPADANMDLLNGVDYKKGCFIGQEVVSRMHRKTNVRKRMRAVKLPDAAQIDAKAGDTIKAGGRTIGTLAHVRGDMGMALIRLDRLAKAGDTLTVNDNTVMIVEPRIDG